MIERLAARARLVCGHDPPARARTRPLADHHPRPRPARPARRAGPLPTPPSRRPAEDLGRPRIPPRPLPSPRRRGRRATAARRGRARRDRRPLPRPTGHRHPRHQRMGLAVGSPVRRAARSRSPSTPTSRDAPRPQTSPTTCRSTRRASTSIDLAPDRNDGYDLTDWLMADGERGTPALRASPPPLSGHHMSERDADPRARRARRAHAACGVRAGAVTAPGMSSTCARRYGGCDGACGSSGQGAAARTVAAGDVR